MFFCLGEEGDTPQEIEDDLFFHNGVRLGMNNKGALPCGAIHLYRG